MPTAFDEAFSRVKELAADFKANENFYLSPQFSEAQARKDYIDEFFIALGWDVNHKTQRNPYEQEVKIERNESGSARKADYAFFLKPDFRKVQFFVEAKKPDNNFSRDDYFQTIRYGWGNTPISVLTNFRQFHILDCRFKPHIVDCHTRIIKCFELDDCANADKFAEIYWLLSREAVADNSIAKRAAELPRPTSKIFRRELFKGADQPPNEAFLIELDGYRERLAKAFKGKNPHLTGEQLTGIVQRVIDRLVFIHFLEDKQIEPDFHIQRFVTSGGSAWENFLFTSANLNRKYNGVVFKPHEIFDVPGFQIDETPFRNICEDLSDPTSSYNFAYIPIHILGSIYERFLGKVITDGARVVEKPEVRKAGGVYYTPEYIVRYIVANTVGKAIEGKTAAEISEMRFADIACGSGSFLIEVFDTLLRWHTKYYNENPGKAKKGDCLKRDDGLHLSLKKKQEILRNNLYGVDIDRQAVEVAQLSLYLKLLEDETIGTTHAFQNEFHYALLPPLTDNIVCGNSLIGPDILDTGKFSAEEERKLNPLDFAQRFPGIFRRKTAGGELHEAAPGDIEHNAPGGMPLHGSYAKVSYRKKSAKVALPTMPEMEYEGGFDAIVGNPPYILLQILDQPSIFDFISRKFRAARYKIDTYHVFFEQALLLTKNGGSVGYITPNSFLRNKHARELRGLILEKSEVQALRLFSYNVFKGASVDTAVIILKRSNQPDKQTNISIVVSNAASEIQPTGGLLQSVWLDHPEKQFSLPGQKGSKELESKIKAKSILLGDFATAYFGIQTFDRTKFVRPKLLRGFKPVIDGGHIERYGLHQGTEYVDFRPAAIKSGGKKQVYEQDRVGVRQIGKVPVATYLPAGLYTLNTVYNIFFTKQTEYALRFILGIVSSKCLGWFWERTFFDQKETFPKIKKDALLSIPVPRIDFSNSADKAHHDKLVSLVKKMLEARKQLSAAKTDGDKDFYSNKCATLDHQIDSLVYELYGLTEEEIKIVEGTNK